MKRIIALCLTLCICVGLMVPAFASEKNIELDEVKITKDNAKEVIEAAKNGDEKAIKAIKSLDVFNKEKIDKVAKELKVTQENPIKEVVFDDGSSIEMQLVHKKTSDQISIEESRYDIWKDYGIYKWYVAGVEVARYTMHVEYYYDDGTAILLKDHWDATDAFPGYSLTSSGTTAIEDYGEYIEVRGTVIYTTIYGSSQQRTFAFTGYRNFYDNTFEMLY